MEQNVKIKYLLGDQAVRALDFSIAYCFKYNQNINHTFNFLKEKLH